MTQFDNTVNVLLGFGGSGGKILKSLMEHMAQDPAGAKLASERCHIVLVDTDEGDLQRVQWSIKEGFERYGLDSPPPIESFSLAEGVDQFQDLVTARMFPAGDSEQDRAQRLDKLKKFWWFRGNTPFSAPNMPENVDKGAAQCPLVSHMLAWDKLAAFERVLAKIGDHALNKRHLERFSVDLFIASGLAGGVKRGDGVAFAAGATSDDAVGGRVYEVFAERRSLTERVDAGVVELAFAADAFDPSGITVGRRVWKTDDPELTSRLRRTGFEVIHGVWQAPRPAPPRAPPRCRRSRRRRWRGRPFPPG